MRQAGATRELELGYDQYTHIAGVANDERYADGLGLEITGGE